MNWIRTLLSNIHDWVVDLLTAIVDRTVVRLVRKEADPAQHPGLEQIMELLPVLLATSIVVGAVAHIVKSRDASDELFITLMLPDNRELSGTLSELTEALKDVEASK